jgi:Putative prokaryotic signal transducing protein
MSEHELSWVRVATYAAGFEADFALARLESAGILGVRRDNDLTGIFGPGFQGATARGVAILVPSDAVEEAQAVLAEESGSP